MTGVSPGEPPVPPPGVAPRESSAWEGSAPQDADGSLTVFLTRSAARAPVTGSATAPSSARDRDRHVSTGSAARAAPQTPAVETIRCATRAGAGTPASWGILAATAQSAGPWATRCSALAQPDLGATLWWPAAATTCAAPAGVVARGRPATAATALRSANPSLIAPAGRPARASFACRSAPARRTARTASAAWVAPAPPAAGLVWTAPPASPAWPASASTPARTPTAARTHNAR